MKRILFSFLTVLSLLSTVNFAQTFAPVTFRLDLNDVLDNIPNSETYQPILCPANGATEL